MVKLRSCGRDQGAFSSAGWLTFARETRLHVGPNSRNINCVPLSRLCMALHFRGFPLLLKILGNLNQSIILKIGDGPTFMKERTTVRTDKSECLVSPPEQFFRDSKCLRPLIALEKAREFKSEYPLFQTVIWPSFPKKEVAAWEEEAT